MKHASVIDISLFNTGIHTTRRHRLTCKVTRMWQQVLLLLLWEHGGYTCKLGEIHCLLFILRADLESKEREGNNISMSLLHFFPLLRLDTLKGSILFWWVIVTWGELYVKATAPVSVVVLIMSQQRYVAGSVMC